jgi:hypothetical protein
MKKTILLSLAPFVFGAVAVQAQTAATETAATEVVKPTNDKKPVKKEELPEAVKTTLASEAYKGWEAGDIFWVTTEKTAYYEITMKQAEKTLLVKLDKEGKKVD